MGAYNETSDDAHLASHGKQAFRELPGFRQGTGEHDEQVERNPRIAAGEQLHERTEQRSVEDRLDERES